MTDLTKIARGKLGDPILMTWALRRYQDAGRHDTDLASRLAAAWFDDLTLRRWIDSDDHELLTTLFNVLPADHFANLRSAVIERWTQWRGSLAYHAVSILLGGDPEQITRLFAEHLASGILDTRKTLGIIEHLPDLSEPASRELLGQITTSVMGLSDEDLVKGFFLSGLLEPTVRLNPDGVAPIFRNLLRLRDKKRDEEKVFGSLGNSLFDGHEFYDLASWIWKKESTQTFSALGPLFTDNAPLEEIDHILTSSDPLPDALALLEQHRHRTPRTELAHDLIGQVRPLIPEEKLPFLGCLALAALLHGHALESLETEGMTLNEVIGLLPSDLSHHRHAAALTERLRAFKESDVVSTIERTMPTVKDSNGAIHLVHVVGKLGLANLIPLLIASMDEDSGDFLCVAAQESLSRLGEPAQRALIDRWDDLDTSQRIYGDAVLQEVGGQAVADFAVLQFPALFQEGLDRWCGLATATPDPRIIKLLEPELRRGQSLIDRTFYQLCVLLDHPYENIDEVRARITEHRQRQLARRACMETGNFCSETVSMLLQCETCGEENRYEVKRVLVSEDPSQSPHVLVDEFPCASCGEWAEFKFTGDALLSMSAEMLKVAAAQTAGRESDGPLQLLHVDYRWEERSAPEVVAELQKAVEQNPSSERDWVVLGRVNYLLGRPRHAGECYKLIYDKDHNTMEAGLGLARVLADTNQPEEAFKLLTDLLECKEQWRFFRPDELRPALLGNEFARLFNSLHRRLNIKGRPMLHSSFMGNQRKVGRNDPCPCGSGKKYKKCCVK